jgi:hypothetical protein
VTDFQVSPAVIYVHKVTVRRPAAQSGQIEPGDVLVAIDGVAVTDSTSLNRYGGIELVYSWYCMAVVIVDRDYCFTMSYFAPINF